MPTIESELKSLAIRIHKHRVEKCITREEAAKQIGVSRTTFERLIYGYYKIGCMPSDITIYKFKRWLGAG